MPRFIGCFDDAPCEADEVQYLAEGGNLRFNISVGYIPGGPSGQQQELRLVSLLLSGTTLLKCLNNNLSSCVKNPTSDEDESNRIQYRRDEPWFDIEINITNAVVADSGKYYVELEADDVNGPGTVTQSTSTINVLVTPTLSEFFVLNLVWLIQVYGCAALSLICVLYVIFYLIVW